MNTRQGAGVRSGAEAEWQADREIIRLLNLFAYILDHREWDRVGEVLAPDATAYGETGLDDIVNKNIRQHLGGCGPVAAPARQLPGRRGR